MYLLVSKFQFLKILLLLTRIAPYYTVRGNDMHVWHVRGNDMHVWHARRSGAFLGTIMIATRLIFFLLWIKKR